MKLSLKHFDFSLEKICALIFVFLTILMSSAFYQGSNPLGFSEPFRLFLKYLIYVLVLFNSFIVLNDIRKKRSIDKVNIYAIVPIVIYFLLTKIHVYSSEVTHLSNIYIVIWVIFCLSSNEIKIKSFDYFKKAFTIICCIGIFCYIAYIFKLPISYSIEKYYTNTRSIYINYELAILQGSLVSPRLCCLFNEPGFLGTVCGFVLCADKLNLKKTSNVIILVAGVLSFSVAFFILIFIYMLLNSLKTRKYLIIVAVIVVSVLFILPNVHTNISIIDKTISRFKITDSGIAADNRTTKEFDKVFDDVMKKEPLFGMGNGYFDHLHLKLVSSYKIYIVDYGIVGFLLLFGSLVVSMLLFKKYDYTILVYIILFLISLYQRPRIFNIQYVLLLYGGISYISNQIEIEKLSRLSRKKKKVIQFIHGLNTGGAENLVKDYALKLDKNKFDITVLCLNHYKKSPYEDILRNNNIKVIYVEDYLKLKNRNDYPSRMFKALQRHLITRKYFLEEDPDIIHFHLQISKYVFLAGISKNVKLIYSMHGEPERYKNMDKIDYYALQYLVKVHNTKIICLHDVMKVVVKKMFKTKNVIVLNNGIDFERFQNVKSKLEMRRELNIPEDAFVIGHVGRFSSVKNHEFIVRVFDMIHEKNTKAFLLLIGDGDKKKKIISELSTHQIIDKCLILSNRDDIPDLLSAMDCFIFPSLSEGLGISLIEAQKAHLPCLVSDCIPNHAIISNLVKKESLKDETKWVDYLLNIKYPKNIELYDENWDINVVVKKLEDIYLEN